MTAYARVVETFEYEVPLRDEDDEDEVDGTAGRIRDFGPDADDVRERAVEFGCEMVSHRISVTGLTHHG